jgi:hypothetical protein
VHFDKYRLQYLLNKIDHYDQNDVMRSSVQFSFLIWLHLTLSHHDIYQFRESLQLGLHCVAKRKCPPLATAQYACWKLKVLPIMILILFWKQTHRGRHVTYDVMSVWAIQMIEKQTALSRYEGSRIDTA